MEAMVSKVKLEIDWPTVRKTRHIKRRLKPPKISKAVKYGLAFFNGLFWGLSILMMTAGYYSIISSDTAAILTTSVFALLLNISVVLLLVGLVMFFVSLSGILGSLRENISLLQFYRRCLIFFISLEIIVVLVCFASPGLFDNIINRDLSPISVARYRDDTNLQNMFDFMQQQFGCCGVTDHGFLDWAVNPYYNCSEDNLSSDRCGVPWSCCLKPDKTPIRNYGCGNGAQRLSAFEAMDVVYTEGCINAVVEWIKTHVVIVGASSVAVASTQTAALYQASRICIILQRMLPRRPPRPPRPPLLSLGMLVWSWGWITDAWTSSDEEKDDPEEDEEWKKKKKRKKRRKHKDDEGNSDDSSDLKRETA